jgi:neutral trehalase
MKIRGGQLILLLVFVAILLGVGGCSTNEPENASVRPWDSPQGWENAMPIQQQQHQ